MEKIQSVAELQVKIQSIINNNLNVGFVPTMGALHHGHLSLIEQAKTENDVVICSIFVNPLQFNNAEDLAKYPNTLKNDLKMLREANCDLVFCPDKEDVYKGYSQEKFDFGNLENIMEAVNRPGHFNGVGNVIHRLFQIIKPAKAYFGEKDYQQLAIIKSLVIQKKLPTEIVGCRTFRNENGLALSSRNLRLNELELQTASKLYAVFTYCRNNKSKYKTPAELVAVAKQKLQEDFDLEYFTLVDEKTLQPMLEWSESQFPRAFVAAYLSGVRLIDNFSLNK